MADLTKITKTAPRKLTTKERQIKLLRAQAEDLIAQVEGVQGQVVALQLQLKAVCDEMEETAKQEETAKELLVAHLVRTRTYLTPPSLDASLLDLVRQVVDDAV